MIDDVWNSRRQSTQKEKELQEPGLLLKKIIWPSTCSRCGKITPNVAFDIGHPIFVISKVTCLATLFDRQFHLFKNSPGIFNELLST